MIGDGSSDESLVVLSLCDDNTLVVEAVVVDSSEICSFHRLLPGLHSTDVLFSFLVNCTVK